MHVLSDATHTARSRVLVGDAHGNLLAVWAWHDPHGWVVQIATRDRAHAFAAPTTLTTPQAGQAPLPQAAMAPDGRAIVSWQQSGRRMALLVTPGRAIGDPIDLGVADPDSDIAVAAAAPGRAPRHRVGERGAGDPTRHR